MAANECIDLRAIGFVPKAAFGAWATKKANRK